MLQRAVSWFSARGVRVERVLSEQYCLPLPGLGNRLPAAGHQGQGHPLLPLQTNGKIERFHHTLDDGWAYASHYTSEVSL